VILKGSRHTVKEAGLSALRTEVASLVPELADRVHTIDAWTDIHFLSVESSRVPTWHRPEVVAIGDAAHVMSPVAGVGINYAIQDAVATANRLGGPLLSGTVSDADLAAVQQRRELSTRFIQAFQAIVQRLIVASALAVSSAAGGAIGLHRAGIAQSAGVNRRLGNPARACARGRTADGQVAYCGGSSVWQYGSSIGSSASARPCQAVPSSWSRITRIPCSTHP
jgi:2-polyprenyl-6-methoxyphenol hydroxylase-like FAD-dependent oxidoreductase